MYNAFVNSSMFSYSKVKGSYRTCFPRPLNIPLIAPKFVSFHKFKSLVLGNEQRQTLP